MKIGREAPPLTLRDTWKSRQMQKKIEAAMRKKSTKGYPQDTAETHERKSKGYPQETMIEDWTVVPELRVPPTRSRQSIEEGYSTLRIIREGGQKGQRRLLRIKGQSVSEYRDANKGYPLVAALQSNRTRKRERNSTQMAV